MNKSRKSAIGELVGEATMCWEHIDKAGVFDSSRCSDILDKIYNLYTNEQPDMYYYIQKDTVETQIETFLLGKILTIIDASYSNIEQRDAVKSLVKEKFHSQLDWMLDRIKSVE